MPAARIAVLLFLALLLGGAALVLAARRSSRLADGVIQSLTHHGSPGAVLPASPNYELISLRMTDGTRIVAQVGRALDRRGDALANYARRPTLIYCYPGGGTLRWSAPQFEGFRRLGLNVVMPEYPGYGMSDGQPTEDGFHAAAEAAYDYVLGREDLRQAGILAAGWSLGGSTVVDLASRRPLNGLILLGTSTTFDDICRNYATAHPVVSWLVAPVFARLGSMVKLDSLARIPAVPCPILLVRGTRDELVSEAMTSRLIAAAKSQVTFVPVAGAGHFDLFRTGGAKVWAAMEDWLARTRPAAAGEPASTK